MTHARAAEILEGIRSARIGIVGDFCLDAYWQIDQGTPELSLETGKPTRAVRTQQYNPGGAGNVAANCRAIGTGTVRAFGIIGGDLFGRELSALLSRRGTDTSGLIAQERGWDTPVYAKPYIDVEEQERIDFGRWNALEPDSEAALIRAVREALPGLDAVIVNQQLERGFASPTVIRALNEIAASVPRVPFILDSRTMSGAFSGMFCKLNAAEACRIAGPAGADSSGATPAMIGGWARTIAGRTGKPVFVTRGSDGILLFDGSTIENLGAVRLDGPIDTVGAGDTTVAAIASSLAAHASLREAGEMGNLAAAVTVKKLRETGTANAEEILRLL
ncbi:MAG TPA: PfkB family carbohydrate kinase [Bacteroidota bacterium]|nr:PfkB family carbohydrate kinase [Bacteroidota bacterium]